MMRSTNKEQSTTKTLTELMAVPANRSCADCRSTLVDASQVHASFSPQVEPPVSRYNNFRLNHQSFAPPGSVSRRIPEARDPPMDPALFAAQHAGGGHGVFVCALCGAAHKLLGVSIAIVAAVQDPSRWTPEYVRLLAMAGGNAKSWSVYEAFMPDTWAGKRPKSKSSIGDRLTFARAKYEALAFVLPPSGPLAPRAWRSIVERHTEEWEGLFWEADLHTLSELELVQSMSQSSFRLPPASRVVEPPNRLVDFFCVVSPSDFLDPAQRSCDLSKLNAPDEVLLVPQVSDCFPAQDSYDDVEFPEHVSTFVSPEGCRPSATKVPPSFWTFVLTTANGNHMYGAVLRLYDEHQDVESLHQVLENSEYTGKLPPFLRKANAKDKNSSQNQSDVIFLPKSLVVLSQYPFFDLWRKFLLQIYRIALAEAPLPIERFIANFVSEVPLPPPGRIQVKFGFTLKDIWYIQLPPLNRLPLSNFSYRPLFASLSVSNVMVVAACLMQETRVALVSRHYALLGPVAQAFLSFLFPFHWQGMFLPVMPYSLLDILDAPIPFLVGLHSRYLVETPVDKRPQGVVFVDLDKDVVHLGWSDDSPDPRRTPAIPERQALKLKAKLDECAASVYIRPDTGKSGSVTVADGTPLPYSQRDSYAHINSVEISDTSLRRKEVFGSLDKAYRDNELLFPISGFLSEHGQLYERESVDPRKAKTTEVTKFQFLRRSRHTDTSLERIEDDIVHDNLLDMSEPAHFSSAEIRTAFLGFFVSILKNYKQFVDDDSSFRSAEFLGSLNASATSTEFVDSILMTQMFSRFLSERKENPTDPAVLFFDESINAKLNRSKKAALSNIGRGGKKGTTAFLDDKSALVTDTFAPPPPSNWGLPDDGRCYHYGSFPELNPELFGKIRPPMQWPQRHRKSTFIPRGSLAVQQKEQFVVAKAMAATPGKIYSASKRGVKNLETAITALSSPFSSPFRTPNDSQQQSDRNRFRQRRAEQKEQSPGRSASRHSVSLSEVTLPSELGFSLDMDTKFASTAEETVLNARRKQAILLSIIIKLQAICRMHLAKTRYRRRLFGYKMKVQRNSMEGSTLACQTTGAVRIQSAFRKKKARDTARQRRALVIRLQAVVRGGRARFAYRLLRFVLCKVQALARGYAIRLRISYLFKQRMKDYRHQIPLLWEYAHTSLCFRSKFWPLLKETGFLRVAIAEAELRRLWKEVSIDPALFAERSGAANSQSLQIGSSLGINCSTHSICLKIASNVTPEGLLDANTRNGRTSLVEESKIIERAASREAAERIQIYERLSLPDKTELLLEYLEKFGLLAKDKKKKGALSEAIWRMADLADQSASFMFEVFPELKDSTNILFVKPSQKGLRRFRPQDTLPGPLDRAMWAHTLLDDRIRRNLKEVALAGLVRIPSLTAKLGALDKKRETRVDRRIGLTRNGDTWEQCRLAFMREFFSEARQSTPRWGWRPNSSLG